MAEWNELAARENALLNMGESRMFEIAAHLQTLGAEFLFPLVDTLGDTEAPRETRHLALFTLQHEMSTALTERLHSLTTSDHDKYARAMATQLIAFMRDESVQPILEQLAKDEEPMVQFTATLGLALLGSREAKDSLFTKIYEGDTTFAEQDRIVQTLAENPEADYVSVYSSALKNPILEFQTLLLSAQALAEVGGPDDITVLENLNPTMTGTDILDAAKDAIAQIKERHKLSDEAAEEEE
jgi:HEAT repeat protein